MKKKLVSFVCAVMVALCLAVSVPVQAYAATEDEIAPQYTGISHRAGRRAGGADGVPPHQSRKRDL